MAVNVTINNIFSSRNPTGISHDEALFQQLIMKYDQSFVNSAKLLV